MKIKNEVTLKDALFNLTMRSGASDEYCKGLVIGIVSAVLAISGCSFEAAFTVVTNHLPNEAYRQTPKSWFESAGL